VDFPELRRVKVIPICGLPGDSVRFIREKYLFGFYQPCDNIIIESAVRSEDLNSVHDSFDIL